MKAPAFLCYASNIIADKRYRLMTPIERSVWVSIYLECWPNHAVPAEHNELAKYLGYPVDVIKTGLTERVLSFFKVVKGELTSPDLEEYREKNRLRNIKKSEGGKKGAERKRYMASKGLGNVQGTPTGTPEGSLIQSKLNQSNLSHPNPNNKDVNTTPNKEALTPIKDVFGDIFSRDEDSENEPIPF
jgi:hypothetical protein